jgi:hypothetical protein
MAEGGGPVDVGTGATITLGTSTDWDDLQLTDLQWGSITRESLPTSHMGTAKAGGAEFGGHTFMPGDLADPGELTATFHFDPDETPPINTATEDITITWPKYGTDQTAANWAVTGGVFLTSFEINDPLEDIMTCTCSWKITGDAEITVSVAAA